MQNFVRRRYKYWAIALAIGIVLVIISNIFSSVKLPEPAELKTITVNAPENMHSAFTQTLEELKLDREYTLEFTNSPNANFVVNQGLNKPGELFAYSPIIPVINISDTTNENFRQQNLLVPSSIDSGWEELDFKAVINLLVNNSDCNIKVYYPAKDSVYWDEFYNFLLFTVNDGYYPKSGTDMTDSIKMIEDFLNCKNAEPISDTKFSRVNAIPENAIYFTSYADLAYMHKTTGITNIVIRYPTAVVYHNYYAEFDEIGKILYESLGKSTSGIFGTANIGYILLHNQYFNTRYTSSVTRFTSSNNNDIAVRDFYNVVEIPNINYSNSISKEGNNEN